VAATRSLINRSANGAGWDCTCPGDPATPSLPRNRVAMESVVQLPSLQGFSLRSSPKSADTCDLCRLSRQRQSDGKRSFAGASQSPLTESNRRPPPYHEREEGVDSCAFAHSGAGLGASLVVASRRVLHGRATLVRPGCEGCVMRRLMRPNAAMIAQTPSSSVRLSSANVESPVAPAVSSGSQRARRTSRRRSLLRPSGCRCR
jgi:hypothetical protein